MLDNEIEKLKTVLEALNCLQGESHSGLNEEYIPVWWIADLVKDILGILEQIKNKV